MKKTLKIKYRFNPNWTYSKIIFTGDKYNIIESSQICPLFISDENKPIGYVVIDGKLWKSTNNKNNLYKGIHTYIMSNDIINVIYTLNDNNNIFLNDQILKTTISSGGSGKYAYTTGKVKLITDKTDIRTVKFYFDN
jgi:hypothetical protein